MSRHLFSDDCPGCRPVMVDVKTRQLLADDSPEMQVINRVWATTTEDERRSFHAVTCQNSREFLHTQRVKGIIEKIEGGIRGLKLNESGQ